MYDSYRVSWRRTSCDDTDGHYCCVNRLHDHYEPVYGRQYLDADLIKFHASRMEEQARQIRMGEIRNEELRARQRE